MFTSQEKEKIKEYYNLALNRIKEKHINCFKGHKKSVFLISDTYPGVWLEHAYDSVFFEKMDKNYLEIAKNTKCYCGSGKKFMDCHGKSL